jgi:lipopolysaccharide export system permease protein
MQRIHFDEEVLRFDLSSFSMSRTSEDLFKEHYQMMNLKQLYTSIDTLKHNRSFRQGMFADQFKKSLSYYYNFYILKKRPPITHMEFKSKSFDELNKDLDAAQNRMAMSEAIGKARANSMMIDNYSKEIGTKDKVLIKHWVEIHRKFTLSIACLLLFFIGAPLGAIIRKGGLGMPLVVSVIVFILYYIISITGEKFVKEGAIVPEIGMWISSAILLPFGIWLTIKTTADSPLMESDRWVKFTERIGRFFRSKRRKNENPAGLS